MTKAEFLTLLGAAYDFPDYYAANLDSADEILADHLAEADAEKLSVQPLLAKLLEEVSEEEREGILQLLENYFF